MNGRPCCVVDRGDVTAEGGTDEGGTEGARDDGGMDGARDDGAREYDGERESRSGGIGEGEGVPRSVAGGVAREELAVTDSMVAESCMS